MLFLWRSWVEYQPFVVQKDQREITLKMLEICIPMEPKIFLLGCTKNVMVDSDLGGGNQFDHCSKYNYC